MTQKNYQAWEVKVEDFYNQKTVSEQLGFLVRFAVLAPSGHNSQPWRFRVLENAIEVMADLTRALPASDTNNRQLHISIGCAIENLLLAADYYGFTHEISYFPEGIASAPAARIVLKKIRTEVASGGDHLIFAIPRRHTNRNPYTTQMPKNLFLQKIKEWETSDIEVHLVSDQSQKEKIADIVSEALIMAMDYKKFRKELSQYLKSNITRSSLGMLGSGFGIPTPLSLIAPFLIKFVNVNRLSRKKDEALLKLHTPLYGIIATKEDTQESWLKSGQLYERIALEAERQHINTHPLAAAIQTGEYDKRLQNIIQISFHPQVFFRMGYSKTPSGCSPRLQAKDVLNYTGASRRGLRQTAKELISVKNY